MGFAHPPIREEASPRRAGSVCQRGSYKRRAKVKESAPSDPSDARSSSAFVLLLLQIRFCLPFGLQLLFCPSRSFLAVAFRTPFEPLGARTH